MKHDDVLNSIPEAGRAYVRQALADPEARPEVMRLLSAWNPKQALANQAIIDIQEVVSPTGRTVVFKGIAKLYGNRLRTAEESIRQAMPNMDTPRGRFARDIVRYSGNPQETLTDYFTAIAADRIAPEVNWEPTGSGIIELGEYAEAMEDGGIGLGLSFGKIFKKIQGTRQRIASTLVKVTEKLGPMGFVMTPLLANPVTIGLAGFSPLKAAATSVIRAIAPLVKGVSGLFGGAAGAAGAGGEAGLPGVTSLLPGSTGSPGSPGSPGSSGAYGRSGGGGSAGGGGGAMPGGGWASGETAGVPNWVWYAGGGVLALAALGVVTFGAAGRRRQSRTRSRSKSRK